MQKQYKMLNKIKNLFTKRFPFIILSLSSQYITFQVNKIRKSDKKSTVIKYLYSLYIFYLALLVARIGVAALVLDRIFTFTTPELYFSHIDPFIGHAIVISIFNRHLGRLCAPFTLLTIFNYWLFFESNDSLPTNRLLYDLLVLNKKNFFQFNPQLGGWTGLAKLILKKFIGKEHKDSSTMQLKVTSCPLASLPNLPSSIRLQAALLSLTIDLVIALILGFFTPLAIVIQPYSFLQTAYLGRLGPRLAVISEMLFLTVVAFFNTLLSLFLGHMLFLTVSVLNRLQTSATMQLKIKIALLKEQKNQNRSLATFLKSVYLPLHNRVVLNFSRANETFFSLSLFFFISATFMMNIYIVTQLVLERKNLKPEMKLHFSFGCIYHLFAFIFALKPMVATQRVMTAACFQHFRSQVYLGDGSLYLTLRLKLAAFTTVDRHKPYAFAFTLGPLGCVTSKFIMEVCEKS